MRPASAGSAFRPPMTQGRMSAERSAAGSNKSAIAEMMVTLGSV